MVNAHLPQESTSVKRDKPKRALLLEILRSPKHPWRKLKTLMSVIGSDAETTKKLLLQVCARASEDDQPLWSLIEHNPLPNDTV